MVQFSKIPYNSNLASKLKNGLMSASDKYKLDTIAVGANRYTHPISSGYKHIPAGGVVGQILKCTSDGTAEWSDSATYSMVTSTTAGLMSPADKTKLDGIATGANKYTLPTASNTTLGGVKTTSTVTSTSGLTACPIINGVPYYKDTVGNYTLPTASNTTLGGVKTTSTVTSTSGMVACPIISGVPYYKADTDVVKGIKLGTEVYKPTNNIATIKAVSVSPNQVLTDSEKANARDNIGAEGAIQLTYAEYKALSFAEQHNGSTYYITDANFTGDNVLVVSPPTSISSIMSKVVTNPSNSKKIRIKLIGDSITEGAKGSNADKKGPLIVTSNITKAGVVVDDGAVGLSTSQWNINVGGHCWANELKKYLEKKYNCEVINYGCGGFSSYNVVNHLTDLIEADDDIIIITIGTNDRISVDTIHGKPTSIETYTANIQTIYNYCIRYGKKVIFMANIPASARNEGIAGTLPTSSSEIVQYNNLASFPSPSQEIAQSKKAYYDKSTGLYYRCVASGSTYMFAEVRHFHMEDVDAAVMAFASRNNIEYISIFKLFSQYCRMINTRVEDLLADNLHPNDEGYDIMFYLITNALGISSQIPGATW